MITLLFLFSPSIRLPFGGESLGWFFFLFSLPVHIGINEKKAKWFCLGGSPVGSLSTISGKDDVLYLVHVPLSTTFRRAHIGDGAAAPFWTLMSIYHAMIMRWRSYNSWQPYRVLFLSIPSVLVGPSVSVGPFGSSNIQNGTDVTGVCCCKFLRTVHGFVKQVVPSWRFAL